jgi:hypothetical protein
MVTPEQRFFISWTTVWRTNHVMKRLKQVKTDPFSGMYLCSSTKCRCFIKHLILKETVCLLNLIKELKSGSF